MEGISDLLEKLNNSKDVTIVNNELPYIFIYQNDSFNIALFNRDFRAIIIENQGKNLPDVFIGVCKEIPDQSQDSILSLLFIGMMIIYDKHRKKYVMFDLISKPTRGITDSISEPESIIGSRDGFVENIKFNITLIRGRIKDSNLKIDEFTLGRRSKTKINVLSIEGLTNKGFLKRTLYKLSKIDVDAVLSLEDITTIFQEHKIMPQYLYTGAPDIACRHLYNGEVIILIENIPNVICLPNTLEAFIMHKVERVNIKSYSIMERLYIVVSLFLSIFFLAILSSFITYQSDSLSLLVLSTLKITQKGVFLPIYVEIAIVLFLFELYYIISFKSPKLTLSSMVVLVGGLIIGENAVQAGIVGVFIIAIVALCFLSSFTISNNVTIIMSISVMRTILLLSSLLLGMVGVTLCSYYLITRISDESGYGISFLYPFSPLSKRGIDSFFKYESIKDYRPSQFNPLNRRRKK